MSAVLELTKELIACPSITPNDAGCQQIIAARLSKIGFKVEHLRFGQVDNLWARLGTESPLLVFAGHTDVVPPGPKEQWHSDPFTPVIKDGFLYGRGAADMKSGLAAMVVATERFLETKPKSCGSLAFLITSDEEGPSVDGTVKVMEMLARRAEKIDWCVLGEPSSLEIFGDTIRHGRRGSLTGSKQFSPTSFQISNFNSGTGAGNIIPGHADIRFNFRYSNSVTATELQERVHKTLDRHKLRYKIEWRPMGEPFLTPAGLLSSTVQEVVKMHTGIAPRLDTGGGTSDGRFIAPTGAQVVEFGPLNTSIHKIDECVVIDELEPLARVYLGIINELLC